MEENNKINEEYKKPLIEIDIELLEMSKNLKIINSLKEDIDQLISSFSNNNDKISSTIKEKYNKVKNQIQKFMNKKKFIYNYIDTEKLSKKNIIDNNNIIEDENEKLIEDKNKYESVKENINKMQKKIIAIINDLDKKISELKIFEKQEQLIEEIEKNDIKENNDNILNKNQIEFKSSILYMKAKIYNDQTKELEEANKIINQIKQGTNEMKLITSSQENTINNLKNEHNYISMNISKGIEQLNEKKNSNENDNKTLKNVVNVVIGLIILIIAISCFLYFKFKFKK